VIAGADSWEIFAQRFGSPVFNFVTETQYVSPLGRIGFEAMWSNCLARTMVDDDVLSQWPPVEQVYDLSGGWPFFGKLIGDRLVRMPPLMAIEEGQTLESFAPHFRVIWNRLEPNEQRVLLGETRIRGGDLLQRGLLTDDLRPRGTLWARFIANQAVSEPRLEAMAPSFSEPKLLIDLETVHLVAEAESTVLEFKSSARWNLKAGRVDKEVELGVLKTVAAFLNTRGGTLLIGVGDDHTIRGIEFDIKSVRRRDLDGLENWLGGYLLGHLGPVVQPYVRIRFDTVRDQTVCRIDVQPSPQPIFATNDSDADFYVRVQNTTRLLNTADVLDDIRHHANFR
jgi:Putative DNA-binding domain